MELHSPRTNFPEKKNPISKNLLNSTAFPWITNSLINLSGPPDLFVFSCLIGFKISSWEKFKFNSSLDVTLQILDFILAIQIIKIFPVWCNVNFAFVFQY